MDRATQKRLLSIAKKAEALAADIRQLCKSSEQPVEPVQKQQPNPLDVDADSIVSVLKTKSRDEALIVLQKLPHAKLGAVYCKLGGSSQEARKPKDMVIKRIMWELFDFQKGHAILRDGRGHAPT